MSEIYLDNSATTRVFPEAAALMAKIMTEEYGNPSSMHHKGVEAEMRIREARETVAKTLKADPKEILFTSCGTESDNLALIGCARANRRAGNHIITTPVEHPAVLRSMEQLMREGFEVTYLPVDRFGRIDPESLKDAVTDRTILVSIMHVNNEIGAIQPVARAASVVKGIRESILFHTDDVQGYGKVRLYPKKAQVDLLSASGHKIHGPKGIGFLYVAEGVKIEPVLYGGGQQNNRRSGTENVPGIAALALAASILSGHFDEDVKRLYELKKHFIEEVQKIEDIRINGVPLSGLSGNDASEIPSEDTPFDPSDLSRAALLFGAPHIISLSVRDVRAEVLLHALEDKGIYVSSGSACATHKKAFSDTLSSIGLEKPLLDSTIRLSMSVFTTKEEIDTTLEALHTLIPQLRRFRPR
ncbi:MAG: cysteine desulfurase [Lachnospiraceae bacterium]|nr:cysteine desulfurase [Lachnospiraceae bacterium]